MKSAACTCDPEAYELGPEGQKRYFPDRGCPVHGDLEWIASKTVPGEDESPSLDGGRERRNGPKVAGDSTSAAKVYAVEWGNEFPAEIDSLWTTEEEAKKRADELGGMWGVSAWTPRTTWEVETK